MVLNVSAIIKAVGKKRSSKLKMEFAGQKQTLALLETQGIGVRQFYTPKSKVLRSTKRMTAVKFKGPVGDVVNPEFFKEASRGWVMNDGRAVTEHEVRMMLRSLDHTTPGWGSDVSLEETYDNASLSEKVKIAEIVTDVNWEEFWKEYYTDAGRKTYDRQADMYDAIVAKIARVLR